MSSTDSQASKTKRPSGRTSEQHRYPRARWAVWTHREEQERLAQQLQSLEMDDEKQAKALALPNTSAATGDGAAVADPDPKDDQRLADEIREKQIKRSRSLADVSTNPKTSPGDGKPPPPPLMDSDGPAGDPAVDQQLLPTGPTAIKQFGTAEQADQQMDSRQPRAVAKIPQRRMADMQLGIGPSQARRFLEMYTQELEQPPPRPRIPQPWRRSRLLLQPPPGSIRYPEGSITGDDQNSRLVNFRDPEPRAFPLERYQGTPMMQPSMRGPH